LLSRISLVRERRRLGRLPECTPAGPAIGVCVSSPSRGLVETYGPAENDLDDILTRNLRRVAPRRWTSGDTPTTLNPHVRPRVATGASLPGFTDWIPPAGVRRHMVRAGYVRERSRVCLNKPNRCQECEDEGSQHYPETYPRPSPLHATHRDLFPVRSRPGDANPCDRCQQPRILGCESGHRVGRRPVSNHADFSRRTQVRSSGGFFGAGVALIFPDIRVPFTPTIGL
jgi:hypothetical protein